MIYAYLCAHLRADDDGDTTAARQELDQELGVIRWQTPGHGNKYADTEVEEGAPAWWAGDEEASQATLAAMRSMGAKF